VSLKEIVSLANAIKIIKGKPEIRWAIHDQ